MLIAQGTTTLDFSNKAASANLPGATQSFGGWLGGLLTGAMTLAAILVFLYLLWGGIEWITSGGDKGKLENARNKITQAVVGLIVLSATTAIFMLLQNFLGICVLNIAGSCS